LAFRAFGNAWCAQAFATAHALGLLGKPTDRETFFDQLPQALDGFGVKSMNATGFTAGFLQPPVFDPTMDDAVNFGGLGAVIGHELSHHLDDEGRKYDELGNARPWWSAGDVARFEQRAQCFADEYDQFHLDDGTRLSGRLTLGENVADNGGRASRTPRTARCTPSRRSRRATGSPQHSGSSYRPRPISTRRGAGESMVSCRTCPSSRPRSRAEPARRWPPSIAANSGESRVPNVGR
jgi:hypothetical protein